jgi:formylglycine-generating enzyme required for sulfatase activity
VRDYVAFLNAVASSDPHGLFHEGGDPRTGILRSGAPGAYVYAPVAGRADTAVGFVSLYDAMRFANWLHHGQPAGAQDASTTEDGAYAITQPGIDANSIALEPGAFAALPSEDAWYKAAYYDAASVAYLDSPAGGPGAVVCAAPSADPNRANCGGAVGEPTDVASYSGSASPNGTFDQGGNVWEWTHDAVGSRRRIRGGGYESPAAELTAEGSGDAVDPDTERHDLGFRVAPEPSGVLPWLLGAALLLGRARRGGR